ncbi:hypothetical protein Q0F98_36905 [Paenibacillus amylolyticus]|nr:hypothetical protein Q0F98_36905 [Paenibacillus amylolyticus]
MSKITETLNGQSIEYAVKPDGTIYMIPATAGAKVYFKNQKPELGEAYFSLFERAEENHARQYGDTTSAARGQVQNFVSFTIDGDKLTAVTYEVDQHTNNGEPFIVDQFWNSQRNEYGSCSRTDQQNNGNVPWRSDQEQRVHMVYVR